MTTLRAAAQQALEALEDLRVWRVKQSMAITALRAALAQQAEPVQEPEGMVEFLADLQRSRTKYPKNRRMFDGLMGEIDELRRAYAGDGDIRAEAFDVAVCAFRIATEGDAGGNARLEQAEPVSADPHTTTLRNLLECCLSWEPDACVLGNVTARQAITALRAALAQQAEPVEPVAWRVQRSDGQYELYFVKASAERAAECYIKRPQVEPLYTAPPQRKQDQRDALLEALRVAAAEREACAKVCEDVGNRDANTHAWDAAAAIRARGNK